MRNVKIALIGLCSLFLVAGTLRAGDLDDVDFLLKQGSHNPFRWETGPRCPGLSARPNRTLRFQVLFTQSCRYYTMNPTNQYDWNKVMGITTNRIHHNSIRLGWRYNPQQDKIDLGFYGYIKGNRYMHDMTSVAFDTWIDVELRFTTGGLTVVANGVTKQEVRSLGLSNLFPTATFILKTCYFGGDEAAPHDMTVRVRNIRIS